MGPRVEGDRSSRKRRPQGRPRPAPVVVSLTSSAGARRKDAPSSWRAPPCSRGGDGDPAGARDRRDVPLHRGSRHLVSRTRGHRNFGGSPALCITARPRLASDVPRPGCSCTPPRQAKPATPSARSGPGSGPTARSPIPRLRRPDRPSPPPVRSRTTFERASTSPPSSGARAHLTSCSPPTAGSPPCMRAGRPRQPPPAGGGDGRDHGLGARAPPRRPPPHQRPAGRQLGRHDPAACPAEATTT
jgi:hypothetical protein